jgi:hypothetical protein
VGQSFTLPRSPMLYIDSRTRVAGQIAISINIPANDASKFFP